MTPLAGVATAMLGVEAVRAGRQALDFFSPAHWFAEQPAAGAEGAEPPSLRDVHRLEEEVDATLARLHARVKDLAASAGIDLRAGFELAIDDLGEVTASGNIPAELHELLAQDQELRQLAGYLSAAARELQAARSGESPPSTSASSAPLRLNWTPHEAVIAS